MHTPTNPRTVFPEDDVIESFPVTFDGEEREYFRLWAANLLLIALTLGLYTPFARRRRIRYFLGLTEVAGSPLDFIAPRRGMFKGFIAFGALYLAYTIAGNTGQEFVVRLFLAGAVLLAPWAWGSRRRFRLAYTRWRGVRLRFAATWAEIYFAQWPLVPLAVLLAGTPGLVRSLAQQAQPPHAGWLALLVLLATGLALLLVARLDCNCTRLLVQRTQVGHLPCRWRPARPRYRDFVRTWLLAGALFVGLYLGVLLLLGVVLVIVGFALRPVSPVVIGTLGGVLGVPLTWIALAGPAALREARVFRLVWNNVAIGHVARLRCSLETGPYVRLCLVQALLCGLTLGLWWPRAAVRRWRMRAESVTLHVKGDLDAVTGDLARPQEALGDAIADMVGLELVG